MGKENSKSTVKKVIDIVLYVLIGVLVVFDIFVLYSKLTMKSGSGGVNFFGTETRIVLTGSMEGTDEFYASHPEYEVKRINVHDAVFVQTVPQETAKQEEFFASFKVGDVMTFYYPEADYAVVTHRLIKIEKTPYNYKYTLKGDNDNGIQTINSDTGYVIGKVTGTNTFLGNFLYVFVENKVALVLIVVVPSAVIALYELGKVFFIIYSQRKEKQLAKINNEQKEKDDELQRLREELERMKQDKGSDDNKEEKPSEEQK